MKIIKRAEMPNGVKIVLVDWSEDYSCYSYSAHIHTYPTATKTDYEEILNILNKDALFFYRLTAKRKKTHFEFLNNLKVVKLV